MDMHAIGKLMYFMQRNNDVKSLLSQIGNDDNFDKSILKACDVEYPNMKDVQELRNFAKGYQQALETSANKAKESSFQRATERATNIRDALMLDPAEKAIRAIGQVASSGLRAGGAMAETNANRLAEALLASSRKSTAKQEELYGQTTKEKLAQAYGKNKIRKGEMVKIATNAGADIIDKLLGNHIATQDMNRTLSASPYLEGVPGDLYALLNGIMSRQYKHDRALGL